MRKNAETYELTKREIYEAAKSQFILDYNYQRKQVHKMKKKENADIEHAKHWRVLAEQFDQRANDTFDKILQLVELINEEEKGAENHGKADE